MSRDTLMAGAIAITVVVVAAWIQHRKDRRARRG